MTSLIDLPNDLIKYLSDVIVNDVKNDYERIVCDYDKNGKMITIR